MNRLIDGNDLQEGDLFCKWLYSRMIRKNKNVLGAETGGTGSGKSYRDLRKFELWYKYYFKQKPPLENICFSVNDVMFRIARGNLRKGELLILEEAGKNLGSLDFQNKVSKLFTYVLQSFRSMNIGILFNLPYLSMLNKQARMLLHYVSESYGIDDETGMNKCKFFYLQTNQQTGKVYRKFLRVKKGKKHVAVKRLAYSMPSPWLVEEYEKKKVAFLKEFTSEFDKKLQEMEHEKKMKAREAGLTPAREEVLKLRREGLTQTQIGEKLGKTSSAIHYMLKTCEKHNITLPDD